MSCKGSPRSEYIYYVFFVFPEIYSTHYPQNKLQGNINH